MKQYKTLRSAVSSLQISTLSDIIAIMSETSYRPTTIVLARRNAPLEDAEHDAREILHESRQYDAPSVPPADRGKDAWLFLTGCFAVEGLLWSFPFAYGTGYYTHQLLRI